jgi:hypothetical protein
MVKFKKLCHEAQHNDTKPNYTQPNNIHLNTTQHEQHSASVIMLCVSFRLIAMFLCFYNMCHSVECHHAECRSAKNK